MFSRAGCADYAVLAFAKIGKYVAQLVLFPDAGELAWYFPKYGCFRWADGAWRPRSLVDLLPDLNLRLERSWLP